jgi:DNA-binding NarL/FixJ family response regulator
VEDNGLFRQTLRESLQKSFPKIAVNEAAEGGEALQKVDGFIPDLVFMDIRLPGENGLELTKKIKATHPDITIFILTDYDTPEYRKAASQCGADRFIHKTSFNQARLEELVKSYYKI